MSDPWGQNNLGSGLSGIAKPEPWTKQARCAEISGDWWFPEDGKYGLEAQRICNGTTPDDACPVRTECLDYALRHKERFGVWGGRSTPDRIRLERAGRGARKCRMCSAMFNPTTANVELCSEDCRRAARRERARRYA